MMSANMNADVWAAALDALDQPSKRELRALREGMIVEQIAPDMYTVWNQSGESYTVDLRGMRCECEDYQYRSARCKHLFRVAYVTGIIPIPDVTGIDPALEEQRRRFAQGQQTTR